MRTQQGKLNYVKQCGSVFNSFGFPAADERLSDYTSLDLKIYGEDEDIFSQ
jgi:hypothetical protein